ncbi:MAG: 3-dehydroquinate synthase [Saprospiraceae bacterium]
MTNSTKYFTDSHADQITAWLNSHPHSNCVVIADKNTADDCYPLFTQCLPHLKHTLYVIPAGEQHKNEETLLILCHFLLDQGFDRNTLMIALGGGVVCDLTGFAASVFKRGVDCIYIPTSLMAMADAAIGGKTGINLGHYKNQLGSFRHPVAVWINSEFLTTLSKRQMKNGWVEMIKHTLIDAANKDTFPEPYNWPPSKDEVLQKIIASVAFKRQIVEEDFYEEGLRKILNFGHTIGHALESYALDHQQDLLHGEAVAAGMIYELSLSQQVFGWDKNLLKAWKNYLWNFSSNLDVSDIEKIMIYMRGDKKNMSGKLHFVLLEKIGQPIANVIIEEERIVALLGEAMF